MKFNVMKACSRGMMILLMGVGLLTAVAAEAAPNGLISTQQLLQDLQTSQQRESVSSFLTRDDVQSQLMARGVDAGDALQRVAAMSSAELASIAAKIDELPAGAGLLETALFLLVIFMLLDIAGVTDIFPGL
jgi:uncharacterized protein YoaH (UPF0181 family)